MSVPPKKKTPTIPLAKSRVPSARLRSNRRDARSQQPVPILIMELRGFSQIASSLAQELDAVGVDPERIRSSGIEVVNRAISDLVDTARAGARRIESLPQRWLRSHRRASGKPLTSTSRAQRVPVESTDLHRTSVEIEDSAGIRVHHGVGAKGGRDRITAKAPSIASSATSQMS